LIDYDHHKRGEAETISNVVESITGHAPRTFLQFAQDYREAFLTERHLARIALAAPSSRIIDHPFLAPRKKISPKKFSDRKNTLLTCFIVT
jgi:hypothetical protein